MCSGERHHHDTVRSQSLQIERLAGVILVGACLWDVAQNWASIRLAFGL